MTIGLRLIRRSDNGERTYHKADNTLSCTLDISDSSNPLSRTYNYTQQFDIVPCLGSTPVFLASPSSHILLVTLLSEVLSNLAEGWDSCKLAQDTR